GALVRSEPATGPEDARRHPCGCGARSRDCPACAGCTLDRRLPLYLGRPRAVRRYQSLSLRACRSRAGVAARRGHLSEHQPRGIRADDLSAGRPDDLPACHEDPGDGDRDQARHARLRGRGDRRDPRGAAGRRPAARARAHLRVASAACVVLCYLPYLGAGRQVFGFLGGYSSEEGYLEGGGFFLVALLRRLGAAVPESPLSASVAAAVLAALAIFITLRARRQQV